MNALDMILTTARAICGLAICLVVAGLGFYVFDDSDGHGRFLTLERGRERTIDPMGR